MDLIATIQTEVSALSLTKIVLKYVIFQSRDGIVLRILCRSVLRSHLYLNRVSWLGDRGLAPPPRNMAMLMLAALKRPTTEESK